MHHSPKTKQNKKNLRVQCQCTQCVHVVGLLSQAETTEDIHTNKVHNIPPPHPRHPHPIQKKDTYTQ